jgi:hypothetical protein
MNSDSLRVRLGGLALAVVVALLLTAPAAHADHNTGVFELDGNAIVNGPPKDDWNTLFAGPGNSFDHVFLDDRALPDPTIFKGGDKDFHALKDMGCVTKNNPVGKLDIRYAYAGAYQVGGDVVVFYGQNRETNTGDAAVGFWFFQDAVSCDSSVGTWTGSKRDGDLLIITPYSNGGKDQTAELYRWNDPTPALPESGDETLTLISSLTLSCVASNPDHHSQNPDLCATTNAVAISTDWDGTVAERKLVEGGINLTAIFAKYFPEDVCYITFMAESRSSTSLSSDLEDFVTGGLLTCGKITVDKVTQPGGDSQQFTFTTAGGPDSISDTYQLTDGATPHTSPDVRPGTYTINETLPAGWDLLGATCTGGPFGAGGAYTSNSSFVMNPGDSISCTFTNAKRARITVDKITDPAGDPQLFAFATSGGPNAVNDVFQLADATPAHATPNLKPGTYKITETTPGGWTLQSATCVGGPFGGGAVYASGGPFTLAAGDEVTCTFTNKKLPPNLGSITVDKITNPGGSPQLFTFTTAGGAITDVFHLADGTPPHNTLNLPAGTYSVTESIPGGWTLQGATCVGGPFGGGTVYTNGSSFALGAGDQVTCTFVDAPAAGTFASITVDKVTNPAGSPQLFTFTTAGGPDGTSDVFDLADVTPPHTTTNLKPGTYAVTETPEAGWSLLGATCVGGPFGSGMPYANGASFALAAGNSVSCTFTNKLQSTAGFCPNASTVKITTSAASGRWPGNKGMDVVVRTDLGQSLQAAIDNAADLNGDGYILIGVQGKPSVQPGGFASQRVVIDDVYSKPFGLIGCSVTLYDPAPQDGVPVIDIQASASAPDLFVMGLYVNGSTGPGWRVNGNGRYIYSSNVTRTATGIWVTGNNNTVDAGTFSGNGGAGILVIGNGNTVKGSRAISNGSHGIQIVGNSNKVLGTDAGDFSLGNGGDGINVNGKGNEVRRNRVFANLGDGIEVTGGTAAAPNVIAENVVGDRSKGNGGYGIFVFSDIGSGAGGSAELDKNTVRANALDAIHLAASATGHDLRNNVSGGTASQDNLNCEYNISAGNFNLGGNKSNSKNITGAYGSPFPTGCLGTP